MFRHRYSAGPILGIATACYAYTVDQGYHAIKQTPSCNVANLIPPTISAVLPLLCLLEIVAAFSGTVLMFRRGHRLLGLNLIVGSIFGGASLSYMEFDVSWITYCF